MSISVIVPTYDEADNIQSLTYRLFQSLRNQNINAELIIVDDESKSSTRTASIIAKLYTEGYPIRLFARKKNESFGLSSAVLLGFYNAKYSIMVCMDADLQHEPESVGNLVQPIFLKQADFVVGSRYMNKGGFGFEWSFLRRTISNCATLLAFPLTTSSDPMSGFFCLSQETFAQSKGNLNSYGFKIGLELMVRCKCKNIIDVPIRFQKRVSGVSKLTMKQNVQYIIQLFYLYAFKYGFINFFLLSFSILFFLLNITLYIF